MTPTKDSCSSPRKQLIETMQRLGFGRIENLKIRDGDPVFSPPPSTIKDIKIGLDCGPRPELQLDDFALNARFVELFQHLDRIGDGTIALLVFRSGLPDKLEIKERA